MIYQKFPHITISCSNINNDIKPLIGEIKPHWDLNRLKIKQMHGGVSNILFGVFCDDIFIEDETDMVLIRLYGELLLDRDIEVETMTALSKHDLAANVLGQFANGCCYQFIHGSVIDCHDVLQPAIYTLIINEFVKLHTLTLDLDRPIQPFLFAKMREVAHHLPARLADSVKNDTYLRLYPDKERIFLEIDELESALVVLNCPVTFCHNDLLARNIVLNSKMDRIHMIDFEYADYNYCAFDIGNHFNEFAGLDDTDYSLYPDKQFQLIWLRQYLETLRIIKGDVRALEECEIEHWFKMTNKFALASHLLWSMWNIWQEMYSCTPFDYLGYALVRWNEYVSKKKEFLSL